MKGNTLLSVLTAATVAVSAVAYGMNVSGFNDYEPPNTLAITWYDYYAETLQNSPSSNNKVTEWPRWSAEFPYRACFFGGKYKSGVAYQQDYEADVFWIYSKKPTTDVFTFEYIPENRNNGTRTGYIRAYFSKSLEYGSYVVGGESGYKYYDLSIQEQVSAVGIESTHSAQPSFTALYTPSLLGREANGKYYFEFDFMYECLDKHQTNAQNLNVSGARSVSGVPYAYILTCDAHGGSGGSTGGSGSSGGSSGGSSSGGGGIPDWNGESISKPDKWPDTSLPSPWEPESSSTPPWTDDKNTPDLGDIPSAPSVPSVDEGNTGERGDTWELPTYTPPDLSWMGDDENVPPMPDITIPGIWAQDPEFTDMPIPDNPEFTDIPIPDNPEFTDMPIPDNPEFTDIPIPDNPAFHDMPIPDNPAFSDMPIPDNPEFSDFPYETPSTVWPPPYPVLQ